MPSFQTSLKWDGERVAYRLITIQLILGSSYVLETYSVTLITQTK